jgi:hypothetical protein
MSGQVELRESQFAFWSTDRFALTAAIDDRLLQGGSAYWRCAKGRARDRSGLHVAPFVRDIVHRSSRRTVLIVRGIMVPLP